MDTQKFKRLPYGSSNFESIITENCWRLPKTTIFREYIVQLTLDQIRALLRFAVIIFIGKDRCEAHEQA
jgi:hypothetical protein